jgi:HAD superfamily hydrolase (TIGR01509 family)
MRELHQQKFDLFEDALSRKRLKPLPLADLIVVIATLFPVACVTSASRATATLLLNNIGLADLFYTVITGDDVLSGKPGPEPYLRASAQIGLEPSKCLAFEGSPSGVKSAQSAGMRVVAINPCLSDELG